MTRYVAARPLWCKHIALRDWAALTDAERRMKSLRIILNGEEATTILNVLETYVHQPKQDNEGEQMIYARIAVFERLKSQLDEVNLLPVPIEFPSEKS